MIKDLSFSVFLSRNSEDESYIVLGGVNKNIVSRDIDYFDLAHDTQFMVKVD
jgi:hypothetical protein